MIISNWVGKRVKLTRKPPNSHMTFSGILKKRWTGHWEVQMDDGAKIATFDGDILECGGARMAIKY